MNASFDQALSAARAAAGTQHYPESTLYVVATPIGNLADISLRALHVLQQVNAIACEDTRHTQILLRQYGVADKPLLALHEHNEVQAANQVIERLQRGERVAYVSDAGTPAVSDPGARLVAAAQAAGLRVMPLPGASSVTAALSVAGLVGGDHGSAFVFTGFLPSKAGERERAVHGLALEPRAVVILEAPHRIEALAHALAALAGRPITVGRELTKQFEEIATMPAQMLSTWLQASATRTRGEFVLVVHPAASIDKPQDSTRLLQILLAQLPLKTAVKLAADISGLGKNELYEAALKLKAADQ